MNSPLILQSSYMTFPAFAQQSDQWKSRVLGAICFSDLSGQSDAVTSQDIPFLQLHASIADGDVAACEVWLSDAALTEQRRGPIRFRYNDELLFGVVELSETTAQPALATPLQQVTEAAYLQILDLLDDLAYPFLYRCWNYMADINGVSHGLERYQQFNLGRQNAFMACGREVAGELPAACALGLAPDSALGSNQMPLTIAFLAGRTKALAIENPRQVSAYDYPRQYGPRSPTFARASLLRLAQQQILFISGTASVVGHETLHEADVVAQTQETIANLQAIITETNNLSSAPKFDLAHICYRVYVRRAADIALIRDEMRRMLGEQMKALFLQADICRQDLLVEIEATAGLSFEFSSQQQ